MEWDLMTTIILLTCNKITRFVRFHEDYYINANLLVVAFAFWKIYFYLEDEYVMIKAVKIGEMDPTIVIKKTSTLIHDFDIS